MNESTPLSSRWLALCLLPVLAAAGCARPADAGPRPNVKQGQALRATLVAASGASGQTAAEETGGGEATGWATLKGTFKFDGALPKATQIAVNKDADVCGKHKLFIESLEVGPNGGLQNAVIWLRTAKVPVHPDYAAQAGREVVLDNKDCRFEPHVVLLRTTDKLVIKNSDPIGHNSKGDATVNSAFNPIIPAGQQFETSLKSEESLPVQVGCNIHPWMAAWLVVRGDPYAAVSTREGSFEIKNLPAGKDLEFQLWQEKVGFVKDVEVAGVKVDTKGRFKLKLNPDETKQLEFKVSIK